MGISKTVQKKITLNVAMSWNSSQSINVCIMVSVASIGNVRSRDELTALSNR